MRVLYIVSAYNREPGDVITPWLVETVRHLRGRGVDVQVLAPSYRGLTSQDVDGVRVHRFRYAPRRWEALTHEETAPDRVRHRPLYLAEVPGYALAGAAAAARLARREAIDVVHVHWPVPHALMGWAARWASGAPLVCTFHGVELTWARKTPVMMPFLKRTIRTADAVTANSSYTERLIRTVYDRPVERIPFGAAIEPPAAPALAPEPANAPLPSSGERPEAESRSGERPPRVRREAGDRFELLFVGRLVERKGVHYLLDALARLRDDARVHLRVVGDGPMRPALEARAAQLGIDDRVVFEGVLSGDVLRRRFAECDAFVLPAVVDAKGDVEGLGVVLIEALSYERPVIASAAGGIVDIVRDGDTGVLVPPGDAAALAHAIVRYVEDPRLAAALAARGRAHIEREFSWPVITERLVTLYERLRAR